MIWKKVNGEVFQKHKKFGLIRNFQNHQKGSSGPFFVDLRILDVVWVILLGNPIFCLHRTLEEGIGFFGGGFFPNYFFL